MKVPRKNREPEILELHKRGFNSRMISEALVISTRYVQDILRKNNLGKIEKEKQSNPRKEAGLLPLPENHPLALEILPKLKYLEN